MTYNSEILKKLIRKEFQSISGKIFISILTGKGQNKHLKCRYPKPNKPIGQNFL